MTISAIVPAAGCGARAALNGNKILAPLLDGSSVLFWTLHALQRASEAIPGVKWCELIVAARREEFAAIDEVLADVAREWLDATLESHLVEGGATRQDSVLNAVRAAKGDFVLVHDAARPCVSISTIARTITAALKSGAAIAALPVSDTVKRTDENGFSVETLDRSRIWLAQTPQVFGRDLFLTALEDARVNNYQGTDCASIVERFGHKVALIEGDPENLKVTYAPDLERAAAILSFRLENGL